MDPLKTNFGAVFIGYTVSLVIFGLTCRQAIYYYRAYPDDRGRFKVTVALAWLLDTIHQAFLVHMLWHYLIQGRLNLQSLQVANWSIIGQVLVNKLTTLLVQGFFIIRIWTLCDKDRRCLLLFLPVLTGTLFGIGYVTKSFLLPMFIDAEKEQWLLICSSVSEVVGDIAIAIAMCLLLRRSARDTVFGRSTSALKIILSYTLATGLLTCTVALGYLISYLLALDKLYYVAIYLVHGKLYANSMLCSLNTRKSLQGVFKKDVSQSHELVRVQVHVRSQIDRDPEALLSPTTPITPTTRFTDDRR